MVPGYLAPLPGVPVPGTGTRPVRDKARYRTGSTQQLVFVITLLSVSLYGYPGSTGGAVGSVGRIENMIVEYLPFFQN
eukprot:2905600-Rhodomonas_salina.1